MYHRVADLASDPQLLAVSRRNFAEQLQVLRRSTSPLALDELVVAVRDRSFKQRSVAITIDDGYADSLFGAKPLLEQHELPATVFVTAGQLDNPHEFWWDELERLLLQPGTLPSELELTVAGCTHRWSLGTAAVYSVSDFEQHRHWDVERPNRPTTRHDVYQSLYRLLHPLAPRDRADIVRALRTWAGVSPVGRSSHRTLSVTELLQLAEGALVAIGSHTMTHPALARLTPDAQRFEIKASKQHLENILQRPVTSFGYPHGSGTAETVQILATTGFHTACSSRPEPVWSDAHPLRLPRVVVRDWDGDTFERYLDYWLRY
jgi:peptidoglycan/xylan/chitin deacetylase (PgdA/CDA1 family)